MKKLFGRGCGYGNNKHTGRCASLQQCFIPLSQKVTCGRTRVCGVTGDRKHCARMASLGLYPGNEIELICPAEGDRCIIKVHGGTISIDRETTENILVTE